MNRSQSRVSVHEFLLDPHRMHPLIPQSTPWMITSTPSSISSTHGLSYIVVKLLSINTSPAYVFHTHLSLCSHSIVGLLLARKSVLHPLEDLGEVASVGLYLLQILLIMSTDFIYLRLFLRFERSAADLLGQDLTAACKLD